MALPQLLQPSLPTGAQMEVESLVLPGQGRLKPTTPRGAPSAYPRGSGPQARMPQTPREAKGADGFSRQSSPGELALPDAGSQPQKAIRSTPRGMHHPLDSFASNRDQEAEKSDPDESKPETVDSEQVLPRVEENIALSGTAIQDKVIVRRRPNNAPSFSSVPRRATYPIAEENSDSTPTANSDASGNVSSTLEDAEAAKLRRFRRKWGRKYKTIEDGFDHGKRSSCSTLGEVHKMLSRPEPRAPPPADAKAFKNALYKKFEKLVYAWEAMDTNEDGQLQYHEFVQACRRIQFGGNLKKVFEELAGPGGDVVQPEQLDPNLPAELERFRRTSMERRTSKESTDTKQSFGGYESASEWSHGRRTSASTLGEVHQMLSRPSPRAPPPCDAKAFKNGLIKKFGKLVYAWQEIDLDGNNVLSFVEFVAACRRIQFGGNLKKIFEELSGGAEGLKPEALDASLPAELDKLLASPAGSSVVRRSSRERFYTDEGGSEYNHGKKSGAETLGEVHTMLSRPEPRAPPPSDAKAFKNALIKKFGKLSLAWPEIDQNGDGALQWHEFVQACRRIQFGGNLKKIFQELTGNEVELMPDQLEPGLSAEIAKSAETREARQRSESLKRSTTGFEYSRHGSATTFGEVHKLISRPDVKAAPPCDAKAFKNALIKKFGKWVKAWQEIDTNGDGLLQYHEFVQACRRIEFAGNFRKIFDELACGEDAMRPEHLDPSLTIELINRFPVKGTPRGSSSRSLSESTSDFDHGRKWSATTFGEVHEMLSRPGARAPPPCDAKAFKNALIKKFGNLSSAWVEIDTNGDGVLSFNEFVQACRRIVFIGNLRKIFDELRGDDENLKPDALDPILPWELDKMAEKSQNDSSMRKSSADRFNESGFNHGRRHSAETLGEVHMLLQRSEARTGPPADVKAFKNALRKKFHNLAEAWEEMDVSGDDLLQYHEFVQACRRIQFVGNLKKVFQELAQGAQHVTPEALDPKLPYDLAKLRGEAAPAQVSTPLSGVGIAGACVGIQRNVIPDLKLSLDESEASTAAADSMASSVQASSAFHTPIGSAQIVV